MVFGRRMSVHQRPMGEVRSAQQKCVRRAMLEPLIRLNLEHLLSTPDFSRAALSRMQVIAAEDVGAASPGLVARLVELEQGWSGLERQERARRLIEASHCCVQTTASRFVPHWAITLVTGVPTDGGGQWRPLEVLLSELRRALEARELEQAGLAVEEIFVRHPIGDEAPLPEPIGLPRRAMASVWEVLEEGCAQERQPWMRAWRRMFGPPSKEAIRSRLFLYLAVVDRIFEPPVPALEAPPLSDAKVKAYMEQAAAEPFVIPDWMLDKHTARGRKRGQGQRQFLTEGAQLAHPSDVLGEHREEAMFHRAVEIYLELERLYGRKSRTAHVRKRWRVEVAP
ncbi:MAG: hypothetical protein AAFX99_05540 [Myxococcota bacterium]